MSSHPALLTDKEMIATLKASGRSGVWDGRSKATFQAIATAAAQKVMEWLAENGEIETPDDPLVYVLSYKDWQALREAIGLGKVNP